MMAFWLSYLAGFASYQEVEIIYLIPSNQHIVMIESLIHRKQLSVVS